MSKEHRFRQVLILGFITSPLELSDSERQARTLNKAVESVWDQAQHQNEIEDRHEAIDPSIVNQTVVEEACEDAEERQNGTAVDPLVSA